MILEIILYLTTNHLIHLCCMLSLNEELRKLMNLKKTIRERTVFSP